MRPSSDLLGTSRTDALPRRSGWLASRSWIQALSAVFLNSWFLGRAGTGGFCAPALNCWACPSANFACPLGALQYSAGTARLALGSGAGVWSVLPVYVLGTVFGFSVLLGRFMCGWFCPFGWLQDLLARLRRRHLRLPPWTGYLRYVFLVGLVFVVPYYTQEPWFSKLCPQGALQGGLLQPLLHPELRVGMGTWWYLKQALLLAWLVAFIFVRRPFCRLMCPLGALFALFYRVCVLQIRLDPARCTGCGWCARICPTGLDPRRHAGSHLCVFCLQCRKCPHEAISILPVWRTPARPPDVPTSEAVP